MSGSIKSRLCFLILTLVLLPLLLTGCGDLVEIQDRDFVLALGISYENEEYRISYSLPDLGQVTDQPSSTDNSSRLRTYNGKSLPEIEQYYNFNSENRLDYRHLQVVILDASVCSDRQAMKNLLLQFNDNYDISHNALVYYYSSGVDELVGMEGINGNIGDHLKKLNNNNHINGMEPSKIGTLIDCIANERTVFIPTLSCRDNSVAVDGGIFFRENQMVKEISQPESEFYFITLGKSNDYLLRFSPEQLVQLKEVNAKTQYQLTDQGPEIMIRITGTARPQPDTNELPGYPKTAMDEYVKKQILMELNQFMVTDRVDYLNLYENSSYKSRQTWLRYRDRADEFIDDLVVDVSVDIHYE